MASSQVNASREDAILVEFQGELRSPTLLAEQLMRVATELGTPHGGVQACVALTEPRVTSYLRGLDIDGEIASVTALIRERFARLAASEIEVSRLATKSLFVGASPDEAPSYHYVVRTDVEPGGEAELQRWYDEEHMPGLAAVPGAVLARRLISRDDAPRFYACYDLTQPEVLKTRPWLAVRETDWSSKVRPTFRHTRRIMSRRLLDYGL